MIGISVAEETTESNFRFWMSLSLMFQQQNTAAKKAGISLAYVIQSDGGIDI